MPTRADYAKINIACKELKIDKYDLLADRYGVESSKQLTMKQLYDLYEHFRSLGWTPRRGNAPAKKGDFITIKPGPSAAQQRKVLAMWHRLGYPMAKLHTRCKKQFGVERFEWLTDYNSLHVLITDLGHRLRGRRK